MRPYAVATEAGHPGLREMGEGEGMDEEELTAARKFGYTEATLHYFWGSRPLGLIGMLPPVSFFKMLQNLRPLVFPLVFLEVQI